MKFDEFLAEHQKLLSQHDPEKAKQFIREINICIEAYVRLETELSNVLRRWTTDISRLCLLRDRIQKNLEKDQLENNSN